MLLVLPTTSATRPVSYFAPQPYEQYPSQGYYTFHDAPRFTAPSYPSHLDPFLRPSAEELEEREYRRALEVIVNHRRRQAEKEAAIRRQQLSEAARQRYFAALAAELQQLRQEQSIAARRAEFVRSQRARAPLATVERQQALSAFLQQLKEPQPITRQPHVVKRKPLADVLKQRIAGESDADITQPIKNILSALEPRPAESKERKASNQDASGLENILTSIFPGLNFRAQPEPIPSTEQVKTSVPDRGKGKTRAVDVEDPKKSETGPESTEEVLANILRHVMGLSESAPIPRSPDEAGPSGSSSSSQAKPAVTEGEQVQIDRAIALSQVERAQNTLTRLQTDFVLPTELDHYAPSIDERDETASISSVSSSDLTKFIPYTHVNKPVYKYENELHGLLEELDRIDSHGDIEVREKRRAVVKAVEKALEGVERVVGEAVEKRLSIVSNAVEAPQEPLNSDVDDNVTKEALDTQDQVDATVIVNNDSVPEPSIPVLAEETILSSAGVPSSVDEVLPEIATLTVPEMAADLPSEQTLSEQVEASTTQVTSDSVTSDVGTEAEPTGPEVHSDAPEIVATFLLPGKASPPSPIQQFQKIDSDSESEVFSLDGDAERSDWSEVEQ
ncbi:hypothetical protein BJ322DRAFT_1218799 [Thelephora terrestris]|uniref:BAG domain-containing protein n=1 Tax=Thelephora terrestris TaxID=56493 RepID=A0A9P6HE03_9AGAM|nr:hypothetical protein BJ322DRAFT_1218799 [Thelephora terrestris]